MAKNKKNIIPKIKVIIGVVLAVATDFASAQEWWMIAINFIMGATGVMLILDVGDQAIKYRKACDHLANDINDLQKELYKKKKENDSEKTS